MATLPTALGALETGLRVDRQIYLVLGVYVGITRGVRQTRSRVAAAARAQTTEAKMTSGPEAQRGRVVAVRRRIRASRAFLYQAWTDPARLVRWFGPKAWTVERCKIDARCGGSWQAWLRRGDGTSVYVSGTYTELESDRRIAFTWNAEGGQPNTLSLVTIEFVDCEDGVEVCLTHRELTSSQAVDMDVGWNSALDSLEEYVRAEVGYHPIS
jgi:uncharacterized protein YndB with AHSA1/START domain